METLDDVLLASEEKMDKAVQFLRAELAGLRTGKASPGMVEHLNVDYYGTPTRLRDIANISTPEPRLIVINPFDPTALDAMAKAIQAANLGITPLNDGRVIRLPIPELSEERRREILKVAKRLAEDQRVAIRNVRREANDLIKALQKTGRVTEDERDQGLETVQTSTDDYIRQVEGMIAEKEKDLLAV